MCPCSFRLAKTPWWIPSGNIHLFPGIQVEPEYVFPHRKDEVKDLCPLGDKFALTVPGTNWEKIEFPEEMS